MHNYNDDCWLAWFDQLADEEYVVINNFLPASLYAEIREFFLHHLQIDDFSKAGIGSSGNRIVATSIRGDYVYWLDEQRDTQLGGFFQLIGDLRDRLNRFCYLSLSGFEFHLAHYPPGSYYHKHLDQFKERNNRMISVIIYLNEQWQPEDAGELKIYHSSGREIILSPLANRCIMFRSNLLAHEVLLTNASRYSLTGWLLYQPPVVASILHHD